MALKGDPIKLVKPLCANCGAVDAKLVCGRCRVVRYCSVAHQKTHYAKHKDWCKRMGKTYERAEERKLSQPAEALFNSDLVAWRTLLLPIVAVAARSALLLDRPGDLSEDTALIIGAHFSPVEKNSWDRFVITGSRISGISKVRNEMSEKEQGQLDQELERRGDEPNFFHASKAHGDRKTFLVVYIIYFPQWEKYFYAPLMHHYFPKMDLSLFFPHRYLQLNSEWQEMLAMFTPEEAPDLRLRLSQAAVLDLEYTEGPIRRRMMIDAVKSGVRKLFSTDPPPWYTEPDHLDLGSLKEELEAVVD